MVRFAQERTKRKGYEEVYDEFELSAPAWKSRRLDADLSPIMEEDEMATPFSFSKQMPSEQATASVSGVQDASPMLMEDMPAYSQNGERALVLYKPVGSAQVMSPYHANVSFKVSPDMIHGLKNQIFKPRDQSVARMDEKTAVSNDSLALVPWVPSNSSTVNDGSFDRVESVETSEEPMDTEVADVASMEMEEDVERPSWLQHCMTPQPLPRAPSPIMWSW